MKSITERMAAWACLIGALAIIQAEDMYLTLDSGVEIALHADYTWSIRSNAEGKEIHTRKVELDDGRTLLISKDGGWGFAGDGASRTKGVSVSTMYAIGVARRSALPEASAAAMIEASRRLALQIQPIASDPEVDPAIIMRCIDNADKDVNTAEEKTEGWRVTVKLTLEEGGIEQVMRCLAGR
jgi:hypothetical protein